MGEGGRENGRISGKSGVGRGAAAFMAQDIAAGSAVLC